MKRFWLFGLFLAGALVALNAPVVAKDAMADPQSMDDMSNQMDDINSALGSMAVKMNEMDAKMGLKFSGDMRIRYAFISQNSSQQGVTIADQSMGRYRARLGAEITRGDFTGKVRFATGSTNSPWSQNNTFDTAMVDPTINVDTAMITWKPSFASGMLTVAAGKMGNPLTKTAITWDPDIQPEGALVEFKKGDFTLRGT
ncbi:MAG TPA: putative porin, partial [bacterium]|nr:putative porin [bacterium]